MVMAAWPGTLKQSPERDFNAVHLCGLSSGEDELSQRRTRTYPEYQAQFEFKQCTLAQLQTLRGFYDVTLNQTQPFSAPWLEDAGFIHHFCLFSGPPKAEMSGLNWDISIDVTIISGVPVDGEGAVTYGSVD